MNPKNVGLNGRVVSFIDIGTNSVRLLVVRLNRNHSYSILSQQKQQVRLGDGEFEEEEILPEAIERLVVVCKKFTELAQSCNTDEFVAVATSAMREAANQQEVLHILRHESRLDVRVISGQEEARLIYLGVSSGINLEDRQAFFIDIGGGSTEIAVGDKQNYQFLDSFKLGAIRLSNHYLPDHVTEPVSTEGYKKIQQHVKDAIIHSLKKISRQKPSLARIEEVRVRAGSRVAEGDVLGLLVAGDLTARVAGAEQAVRSAQARLALARSEFARAEELLREGVGTRERLDQAAAELRAAEAGAGGLGESLTEARTTRSFTEIRAPVSGRVVDRLAEPGDVAVPGTPLLRIYDPSVLRIVGAGARVAGGRAPRRPAAWHRRPGARRRRAH